jgi:hypothetical protein
MSRIARRNELVRSTRQRLREWTTGGVPPTPAQVRQVEDLLIGLACHGDLFTDADYPVRADGRGGFYRVSEEADRSNAIYVSVGVGRRSNTPHPHPSWAVITGIAGDEHNVIYERTDDGSVPGRGTLHKVKEITIAPGVAQYIPAGHYHTIAVEAASPVFHLHVYGIGVDGPENGAVPVFDSAESGRYRIDTRPGGAIRIAVPFAGTRDILEAAQAGEALHLVLLDADAPPALGAALASTRVPVPDALAAALLPDDRDTTLVLVGSDSHVLDAGERLARRGYYAVLRPHP